MYLPDGVQPMGFELFKYVIPKFGNRQALIVKFAGEDEDTLAIDLETIFIPGNYAVQTDWLLEAPDEGQQAGENQQAMHRTCWETVDLKSATEYIRIEIDDVGRNRSIAIRINEI
jgi:hypothetical protein